MTTDNGLQQTLAALREATLQGQFERLRDLRARLESDLGALPDDGPENPSELHRTAAELMQLLRASGQGLKAAYERLRQIEDIRRGGGLYSDKGERRQLQLPPQGERRL